MRKLLFAFLAAAGFVLAQGDPVPDFATIQRNIPYDSHPETVLDVLQPKAPAQRKRPGVICIHGGGWMIGSKEERIGVAAKYVEKGFVAAVVEYRLAKAATAPAAVEDVLKAAQWFRKNAKRYNVDPKRIIVEGGSAGGHLALMVGITPKAAKLGPESKVRAVVNFYGITDVGDQLHGKHAREYTQTWIPEQPGRMDIAKRVSPLTYVSNKCPPVLTIHGDCDRSVPYEHGVMLTKALQQAGVDAELITVKGGGHGGFSKEKSAEIYSHIWDFLCKHGVIQ